MGKKRDFNRKWEWRIRKREKTNMNKKTKNELKEQWKENDAKKENKEKGLNGLIKKKKKERKKKQIKHYLWKLFTTYKFLQTQCEVSKFKSIHCMIIKV